jgi:hypothetical protein
MKKVVLTALLAITAASISQAQVPTDATAGQQESPRTEKRQKRRMDNMTPEQKAKTQENTDKMQSQWNKMTPEEKEATKGQLQERRGKVNEISPDERKATRSTMKGKRELKKHD